MGIVVGVLFIVVILVLVFFLVLRRKKLVFFGINGGKFFVYRIFEFGYIFFFVVIREVIDNFSESLVIGVGGFGKVYKGVLKDNRKVVIKRGNFDL